MKLLEDYYTIESTEHDLEKNRNRIKNSKMFICLLNENFLSDEKCVQQLEYAVSLKKEIINLYDEKNNTIVSFAQSENIKLTKFVCDDEEILEKIKRKIDKRLK